jgi:hypothetical protein
MKSPERDQGEETPHTLSPAGDNEVKPVPVWLIPIAYLVVGAIFGPFLVNAGFRWSMVPNLVMVWPLHSGVGSLGLILMLIGLIHRGCLAVSLGCFGVMLLLGSALLTAT